MLIVNHQCRLALQISRKIRNTQLRWNSNTQMHMVCAYCPCNNLTLLVLTQRADNLSDIIPYYAIQLLFLIFGDKHNIESNSGDHHSG